MKKIQISKSQKITFYIYFAIFLIFCVYCLYPLFWCICNSLKTPEEYFNNPTALPESFNLLYYGRIFQSFKVGRYTFWEMAFNSIWQAGGWQLINVVASVMVAYPLARNNFPLKGFFYGVIIFRITIPVIGAGPATYKFFRTFNMLNNPLLYSLNYFNGFDMAALILYGYFKGISKEYSEAAYLDGATRLQTLVSVVLPQAFPCILALYINNVMSSWNIYSVSQLYMTKYPNLAYGLFLFENTATFIEGSKPMFFGAVIISASVPLLLFIAGQKTMLQNMSVGGLKG